jgi:hypothetical protein
MLLLELVRAMRVGCWDLDEDMTAAKTEGRRLHWRPDGGALEFV